MQVFLSYVRAEATSEVDQLRNYFQNANLGTWVDRHDLEGGADWWVKASRAITNCDAFILLVTPGAPGSGPIRQEVSLALSLHKDYFPALIKPAANLPPEWQNRNWRDLTSANYTDGLTRLIGDLRGISEAAQKNLTELLVQPAGAFGWKPLPAELQPLVKDLVDYSKVNVRPPEAFFAFREVLEGFRDAAQGHSLYEVVHEFLYPSAAPPAGWPHNVIAAHRSFFETVIGPMHDKLDPGQAGEPVPIVLAVMTRSEADELEDGTAFQGTHPELIQQFTNLKNQMPQGGSGDWVQRYGSVPEEWVPYEGSPSIGRMVRDELARISTANQSLYAKFVDIRALNAAETRSRLKQLRYQGCVVIMDLLSICHPRLHEAYLRSMLFAQEKVMLVQMSPFGSFPPLSEVTLTFKKRLDLEFWDRFKLDRDMNCKRIGDEVDLQRFISSELTNVLPVDRRPGAGAYNYIKQRQP
jgi:hypothetical protein